MLGGDVVQESWTTSLPAYSAGVVVVGFTSSETSLPATFDYWRGLTAWCRRPVTRANAFIMNPSLGPWGGLGTFETSSSKNFKGLVGPKSA